MLFLDPQNLGQNDKWNEFGDHHLATLLQVPDHDISCEVLNSIVPWNIDAQRYHVNKIATQGNTR